MKKFFISFMIVLSIFTSSVLASGNVTYDGYAGEFIFEPGSKYSVTDLFTEFKDVMPGDQLTQTITVYNDVAKGIKVKIYMRSLGAHENSKDFLSQLNLTVSKSSDNEMDYMFDASADQKDGLEDWVLLGTLYSGGKVNLDVTLEVPVELDNTYMNQIGYLDWEFKVEEFPVEVSDPETPSTGDDSNIIYYIGLLSVSIFIILLIIKRKKEQE